MRLLVEWRWRMRLGVHRIRIRGRLWWLICAVVDAKVLAGAKLHHLKGDGGNQGAITGDCLALAADESARPRQRTWAPLHTLLAPAPWPRPCSTYLLYFPAMDLPARNSLLLLIDVTHPPSTRFVRLHSIAKSKQYLFDFYPVFHKKFINCELSNRRRSTVLQYQWFGKNLEELEKLRMKIVLHLTNFAQSWHSTCLDIFIGFFALLLFSKTQHWRPHPTPPLLCISDIHMTAAPPPLTNEIPFQKLPPNKSPSFPKPASYLSNSPGTIFQHVSYF